MAYPSPDRVGSKTSSQGGAAAPSGGGRVPGAGRLGEAAKGDRGPAGEIPLNATNLFPNPKFQMGANQSQAPYILPGQRGVTGKTWQVGTLRPYYYPGHSQSEFSQSLKQSNYGFRFHYNPASVSLQSPTGFDYEPSALDTGVPLTAAPSTISFQTMINRSEDIYENRPLDKPMLGCRNMNELGTQYDIEWLFRTINGLRVRDSQTETADIGLLLPTPVELRLSKPLTYPGYLANVQIDHVKFTPSMVPMVTMLSISFARFTNAQLPLTPEDQLASNAAQAGQVALDAGNKILAPLGITLGGG